MPYVVQTGDTLWRIAQRTGVTVSQLLAANPQLQNMNVLLPGQQLNIPGQAAPTTRYTVQPGDTYYRIAQRFQVSVAALASANPQVNPADLRPGMVLSIPSPQVRQYVVQPGDTLYRIALKLGVTVPALLQVNPGIDPNRLLVGERLNLPAPAPAPAPAPTGEIVIPREGYGYDEMMTDLRRLTERYPFIQLTSIGESVEGRSIPVLRLGTGPKEVHYEGAMHAEEWITTPLLMKFIERYAAAYARGDRIGQYDIPALFRQTSLWVAPMVNPDGVELEQNGISPDSPYYDLVVNANGGSLNFRSWAANIRGVDLNNQFPADFEREKARGPQTPAPRNYSGPAPLSEPEAKAVADFTQAHNFRLVIAWHTQGREIYWGYEGYEPPESEAIAQTFAASSGYTPVRYVQSWAGYKDWFIQDFRRPGFTVEVGIGTNPLPISQFWTIWGECIGILLAGLAV